MIVMNREKAIEKSKPSLQSKTPLPSSGVFNLQIYTSFRSALIKKYQIPRDTLVPG